MFAAVFEPMSEAVVMLGGFSDYERESLPSHLPQASEAGFYFVAEIRADKAEMCAPQAVADKKRARLSDWQQEVEDGRNQVDHLGE